MKAAVLEGLDKITVKNLPKPTIDDDSILIKVKACAVCGSDIRIFHSGNSRVSYPAIIGHEISGQVVEAGKNVRKFKVGDKIAVGADVPCGECEFCEAGIGNNCQINYAVGYQFQGGYAQYMHINKTTLNYGPVHKISDCISWDQAALAEPLGCVLNALELSPVKLGDVVVIIGAGPIGCMIVEVAKKMGAGKVILVQRSRRRLELAMETVDADVFVCSSEEDSIQRVLKETKGLGADLIFTACPSPEAQKDAISMAKNRARINFFGGLPNGNSKVEIDTNIIHYKELLITGAHGAMPIHHMKAIELIESKTIDVRPFISDHFTLDQIGDAFKAAQEHKGMRMIVTP